MEPQLVHICLHEMYPRVFFEQLVLHVLTELNVSKNTGIVCGGLTTGDFPSSNYTVYIIYLA